MASARFRNFPWFAGSRKFAEAHGVAVSMDSGDEIQLGNDGILGLSDGIIMVQFDLDFVLPVSGTKINLLKMFLNKEEFMSKMLAGGQAIMVPSRITNLNLTSESKNGTATGKITVKQCSTAQLVESGSVGSGAVGSSL